MKMKELLILLRQLKKDRSQFVSHGELGKIVEMVLLALDPEKVDEAQRKLNTE